MSLLSNFRILGAVAVRLSQIGTRKISQLTGIPYYNEVQFRLTDPWCITDTGVMFRETPKSNAPYLYKLGTWRIDNWGLWTVVVEPSYDGGGMTYIFLTSNEKVGDERDQLLHQYKMEQDLIEEECARIDAEERQRYGGSNVEGLGGMDPLPESTIPPLP